jgi:hypothetical protein
MSSARFITGVAIASLAALGFACTGSGGGPGGVVQAPTESRDPAGPSGAPESPGAGSGRESPGPGGGQESPGGGQDSPGSSSGISSSSSSSGGGTCSYCNKTYTCTSNTSTNGNSDQSSFTATLSEVNGQCIASTGEDGGTPAVFSCSGTLTTDGQTVDWTADGAGGFAFTESISYAVNGTTTTTTVAVTCDPSSHE